jgi:hypothetical protein
MDDKFKKGIGEIKKIKLSKSEKEMILMRVMRAGRKSKPSSLYPFFGFWQSFSANHHIFAYAVTPLVVIALIVGTSSYGAEASLPGDTLYPLKLNLNEEVRGLVSMTPEGKISWEAQRAVRRIEEAVSLASDGKLDEESFKEIEKNFDKHFDKVENSSGKADGATSTEKVIEIKKELDKKLEEQAKKLGEISEKEDDGNKERARALEKKIREKIKDKEGKGREDSSKED